MKFYFFKYPSPYKDAPSTYEFWIETKKHVYFVERTDMNLPHSVITTDRLFGKLHNETGRVALIWCIMIGWLKKECKT